MGLGALVGLVGQAWLWQSNMRFVLRAVESRGVGSSRFMIPNGGFRRQLLR